jgi:hypothetical protein
MAAKRYLTGQKRKGFSAIDGQGSGARGAGATRIDYPRSLQRKDKLEFDAEVGRLKFTQDFFPDDRVYQGKLEL